MEWTKATLLDVQMIWVVTFAAVIILNVTYGLITGVAFALCTIIYRAQRLGSLWMPSTGGRG